MFVMFFIFFFFFKQKTAYEMRISDWSSDVCSSDLLGLREIHLGGGDADRQREHLLVGRRDQRPPIIVPRRQEGEDAERRLRGDGERQQHLPEDFEARGDRKSTRLNSSH